MEDRRGMSTGGKVATGGGVIAIIVIVLQLLGGGEVADVLNQIPQQGPVSTEQRELTPEELELGEFTEIVLADTEDVWNRIFAQNGADYREPGMVLRTRFGARGGDFAIAYVIAHEVGHHIQNLAGTAGEVRRLQQGVSQTEANELSVALELQADYYAGVWAHHNRKYLDVGDIEEAMSAASAVGDDAIMKKTTGRIVPDAFTHGTSQQRMEWFRKGYRTGDINQGNTFQALLN